MAIVVPLVITIVGVHILTSSHAATSPVFGASLSASGTLGQPATIASDATAIGGKEVVFGGPFYTGKLLSVQATSLDIATYTQLHANSSRPEINFDLTSDTFDDIVAHDGNTTEVMLQRYTSAHIQPIPLLETYQPITATPTIYSTPTVWANAVVSWCKTYCYGGSFYVGNTTSDQYYAPHVLEILNEPYGGWYRSGAVPPADYAGMLTATRKALDAAGLQDIGILGASGDAGHASWTAAVAAAGGYNAVIGLADHPYVNTPTYRVTPITTTLKPGFDEIYYYHQLYNLDVYVTEVGWCSQSTIDNATQPCANGGRNETEADKDANITDSINQVGTVSWIKDFNYYNLHDNAECIVLTVGQPCVNQYMSYGLILSTGAITPAFYAYQTAAAANGF